MVSIYSIYTYIYIIDNSYSCWRSRTIYIHIYIYIYIYIQANSLDCNKRGDLTVLNLSQSTAKQDGKKPTTLPFVPDNPDGRISELLLDTTVVHPLPGHFLFYSQAVH